MKMVGEMNRKTETQSQKNREIDGQRDRETMGQSDEERRRHRDKATGRLKDRERDLETYRLQKLPASRWSMCQFSSIGCQSMGQPIGSTFTDQKFQFLMRLTL